MLNFLPPERVTVNEWARANRWTSGARSGLWDPSIAPYLEEPQLKLTDPDVTDVVIPGPGQCGKTAIAENWLGASIMTDPADFGWYLNTDDVRNAYVKDKISKFLELHDQVRAQLGTQPTDNSLSFKRFRGMTVQFLTASPSNLVNKTFQRIVADEWDNYDPSFGDPKTVLDVRRQTYGRDSKLLAISHMDRAHGTDPSEWRDGIMGLYARSTRCTWWWPCPHCGAYSSPNPGTLRHMPLVYPHDATPEQAAREARLECGSCGALIDDADRAAMNRAGKWVGRGELIADDGTVMGTREPNAIAGYWIVGVMSPFLLHGIGGLAAARVAAERMVHAGDPGALNSLREVLTKQWGVPFTPLKSAKFADAITVADRADPAMALGVVPAGVRFLVTAIDVQANRFELLTRGFGPDFESWVIDVARIPADPATDPHEWDRVLRAALEREFPLADGSGRIMRPRAVGYDSGGKAGVTEQAYAVWRRARRRLGEWKDSNLVRHLGQVSGRDAWSLLPLKGGSGPKASRLVINYPDGGRKDRHASARGEVPLAVFNADMFKDSLQAQLARAEPGPPAVHIPFALRGNWPEQPHVPDAPHPWFAQLFAETRRPDGRWVKVASNAANEATDLMVMTHVIAHLHASRVDWARPPAWCAEWSANALVFSRAARQTPGPSSPLGTPGARDAIEIRRPREGTPAGTAGAVTPASPPRRGFRGLAGLLA